MILRHRLLSVLAALALAACSPSLDWREVRPGDAGVLALFPCKPEISSRPATQAEPVRMGLAQCDADGLSFALSWADLGDPALITPALRQMREALAAKLGASAGPFQALQVPGMTPNPQAGWQSLTGTQQARIAVFSRGPRVYQAVMLGAGSDAAVWDNFVGGLKLGP
jgi:hypothetical protein